MVDLGIGFIFLDTQDPDADTDLEAHQDCQTTVIQVQPSDVNMWTTEHVKLWLIKEGFEEVVEKFEGMLIHV